MNAFYRALLWLYPASFRREYGPEMAAINAERAEGSGAFGQFGLLLRAVPEVVSNAAVLHWELLVQDLLTRIQARGLALPSSFVYNGVFYIRVCIANHRTTQADLAFFLEKIDEVSTDILTGELLYAN